MARAVVDTCIGGGATIGAWVDDKGGHHDACGRMPCLLLEGILSAVITL